MQINGDLPDDHASKYREVLEAMPTMALTMPPLATAATGIATDELRDAVEAYSDAFLTGDASAYEILSPRCRDRFSADQFEVLLDTAKSLYGSALVIRSFSAEVSGALARATYTYDVSVINQSAEPWTREAGESKQDDC